MGQRLFDIIFVILMGVFLVPIMGVIALIILIRDGRPIIYRDERMNSPTSSFKLLKFRTMKVVENDSGVTGADKAHRITPTGHFLRRYRLDEFPQLWNILKGDIGYVGPRPPVRRYVERFPEVYAEVLKHRPGVTGLATLVFHRTEERLLRACKTAKETEDVYERRCIPVKAKLDLIYGKHRSMCLDVRIMTATVFRKLPPMPRRR